MKLTVPATLHALFHAEVAAELAKQGEAPHALITDSELVVLPAPVQRFFRSSGFVGKPHAFSARIVWSEMLLKRSPTADWMATSCEQFEFVREPARIALMTSKLAGVVPFEGRDKFQDGHGNMRIKLLKLFTVADSSGRHMDESALVTLLSEALLTPSLALQPYVRWEAIDDYTAAARLTHRDLSVRGVFTFNGADELVRFDTQDRWQDGAPPRKLPWSAHLGDYGAHDGVRFPRALSATWHEPGGDFTYVKGRVASISFNVRLP